MKKEQKEQLLFGKKLIEKFQVDELENRFEMGRWLGSVKVTATGNGTGKGFSATFKV